jgi:hypothetical protein
MANVCSPQRVRYGVALIGEPIREVEHEPLEGPLAAPPVAEPAHELEELEPAQLEATTA